jgi:hypothetical protein
VKTEQREWRNTLTFRIIFVTVLFAALNLRAQNVPADDVANALDSLKLQAVAKIDQDLDANARAFADARNFDVSARWSDWFSPFLDIARSVYDGLTAISIKQPTSVRSWVNASLQVTDSAQKVFSLGTTFDRFWQDGQNLALTIDGPAYTSTVDTMLDRADATWFLIFDYDSYRSSIQNDLNGIAGWSPMCVAHKTSTADRSGGEILPTVYAAKNYIYDQLRTLSTEMHQRQLPPARISELTAFIEARRRDLQNSRTGNSQVSYSAYLLKDASPVLCPVNYSLGSISALRQWDWTMQAAYAANLDIEFRVRLAETADTALSSAADLLTEQVNLNLSVEAVIAGQPEANEILKNATSLGFSFAKPDVGTLFNMARTNASNAREQVNMIPQQMMDALPGEVSKVLLLVDDTMQYVRTLSNAPTSLVITSVSPSVLTGLPLSQTQLLHIYGSGFTSSSTLLFNGTIVSDPARLYFISPNEIDYYIRTDTNAANWTVRVINGSQQSAAFSFTVVAPPPPSSGTLSVTLQPAGVMLAGAQWQVDSGSYHNTGDVVTGLTPGTHTISCKGIAGYTAPVSHSVSITGGVVTSDTETYSVVAPSTYTLTLNQGGSMGYIVNLPSGTWNGSAYVYTAGSLVQLTANANIGYHFTGWSGDASGAGNPITITMNSSKDMTANFASGDPNMGTVTVTILPQAAATAGVTWGFNANDFRASGSSYTTWPAPYILSLHTVDGWLGPSTVFAPITAGQTTNYTVTFTPDTTPGLLTVTLSPPDAVAAGAHWHANGGTYGNGASASLPPGNYTVTFDTVAGWSAPASQNVTVQRSQTTVVRGYYIPPAGQPVISAIQPSFAALAGGTTMTIEGLNFTAPATVLVGGNPAKNVNVLSPSQIVCLTPSNSVYGTQPVVVQTTGGSATNLNGFAYGFPQGNGIQLAGSIGGNVSAVAAQGSYCYIGEGSTFRVLDASNPSAPSPVGSLAMPGLIQDITIFTISGRQYAAVADNDAGLQIVDVTTATTPALRGYYNTGDYALGVAVFGTNAYIANGNSGFMVFDISNPIRPKLVGSLVTSYSDKVAVQTSSGSLFAYVSAGGALAVVDVSTPSNPVLRGQTSAITTSLEPHSLAVSGNRAFLADSYDYLQPIDITNPNSPTPLGSVPNNTPSAITITNGRVYTSGPSGLIIYNLVNGSLTQIGYLFSNLIQGNNMVVVGGFALCGSGQNGLAIFDVSTPSNPIYRGLFGATDGSYTYAAINGKDVYAATLNSGLKIYDVSDPANPSLESQYVPSFNGWEYVQVLLNRAYFLSGGQINILDVSNPSRPILLGTNYTIPFLTQTFYVSGNSIVAGGYDRSTGAYVPSVETINVSNPGSLSTQSLLDLTTVSGGAWGTTGNGNIACVALPLASGGDNSLAIINVSNPSSLQQIGQLPDIGMVFTMRLAPDNRYLYVGCYNADLSWKIIDLENSNSPVLVSSNYVGSAVSGFDFSGTTVYIAAGRNILVYDVSNPAQPKLVRSYTTPNFALDVKVSGNTLFVSDQTAGLITLKLTDIDPPEVFVTAPTSSPIYTNTTGTLNLSGNADDNLGLVQGAVAGVTWANNQGGGGNATGTTNWSVNGITLLPGTNILSVTATDTSGNSSNATLTVIYQTANQNQTITFPAIADHTFGDAPIPLVAAASSGLPVTFNVVSGPAILTNSNVLTLTCAGAVTVQANQAGNGSFNSAPPVNVSFNVAKANQSIAFAPVSVKSASDAPFALTATTSSGLPVYFDIVSGLAVVDTNIVTLLGGGAVTVRAWQSGNSNYNAAAAVQQNFTVTKVPQTITFGALSQQTAGDAAFLLTATADSGLPVSFSVSGAAVLSGNIVTLTSWGNVTVTASQPGNNTYAAAANVAQSFFVVPPANTLASVGLVTNGFQMDFYGTIGSNYTLQASTDLANWTSVMNFTCTNSPTIVVDPGANYLAWRFYRIAQGTLPVTLRLNLNTPVAWSSNGLRLKLEAPLGFNYTIQVSSNLVNWQPFTNFVGSNSPLNFSDPTAKNFKQRFYRAVMP